MAGKGKAIAKGTSWLAKKISGKGIGAWREANKGMKAAQKEIDILKKIGPKQASGVGKNGKQLNQAAKEAQQVRLNNLHQNKVQRLEDKITDAEAARSEARKVVGKRALVAGGVGGYMAVNNARNASLRKEVKDLREKQSNTSKAVPQPPKQETAPTPATEQKTPETSNNGGSSSSNGGSRSSGNSGARVRVRENSGSSVVRTSSNNTHNENGVRVRPSRRKEDVFNKESGKTERYGIKQREKTKRTEIRAERSKERQKQRTARQNNRQANKSARQAKRQDRRANKRNR